MFAQLSITPMPDINCRAASVLFTERRVTVMIRQDLLRRRSPQ